MVAVSNYIFHAPEWVSFRLIPIGIAVGFAFTVANDVKKMRSAA